MVDLSEYTLVLANRAQVIEHLQGSMAVWGRGRDFNEAVKQYDRQRSHAPWGINNRFLIWVLVKRTEPEGPIYSGCGTKLRGALIQDQGSEEVRNGVHYAIVSVVTPAQHLRNGFATHMLKLLHYVLADKQNLPDFPSQWGTPPPALPATPRQLDHLAADSDVSIDVTSPGTVLDHPRPPYLPAAIGSLLWSDVGYHFYAKCTIGLETPGWVADTERCRETLWDTLPPKSDALDGWDVLYRKDFDSIKHTLSEGARAKMQSLQGDKPVWTADPASQGTLDFLQFTLPFLSNQDPDVLDRIPVAIRRTFPDNKGETIIVLAYDNKMMGDFMLATYIHNLPPQHVGSMLGALDHFAAIKGHLRGWAFDTDPETELAKAWAAVPGRNVQHRPRSKEKGHVLGVAWYGKPEPRGELLDDQMWQCC